MNAESKYNELIEDIKELGIEGNLAKQIARITINQVLNAATLYGNEHMAKLWKEVKEIGKV